METVEEYEDYRALFYWYRYQFFIRSDRFLREIENIGFWGLWEDITSDFYYISRLALDPDSYLLDWPFADTAPELSPFKNSPFLKRRGRPLSRTPELEGCAHPARPSKAAIIRDPRWPEFLLGGFLRKQAGGRKRRGDVLVPFAQWERCLIFYDNEGRGRSHRALAAELNNKTFLAARESGMSPRPKATPPWEANRLDCPDRQILARDNDDPSNLRAVIREDLREAERLIQSAADGRFPE